jgi:hypothetical protein
MLNKYYKYTHTESNIQNIFKLKVTSQVMYLMLDCHISSTQCAYIHTLRIVKKKKPDIIQV